MSKVDESSVGIAGRSKAAAGSRRSQTGLRASEMRLRLALESGSLGSFDLDLQTRQYLEISDIWRFQFGVPPDTKEFSSAEWLKVLHPNDRSRVSRILQRALKNHQDYSAEYRIMRPDGILRWISAHGTLLYSKANEPLRLIGVTQDITDRKAREAEQERALQIAQEKADLDPLTGLLNHRAFHKKLQEETARAQREGMRFAVVMLDLDGFGFFNNVYGHAYGDIVLGQVAERLQSVCRPYDTPARFGGDEFSLLLSGIGHASGTEIETRLRSALSGLVFRPEGQEALIPITMSLGVAIHAGDKTDGLETVKFADERLLRAKTGRESETDADQVRLSIQDTVQGYAMLDALVTAVDNKDRYTRRHSEDVMGYSLMIARELGQDEKEQRMTAVAALLHDLGKIGVSDAILRKPGGLTEEEFAAVRRHPQTGAIIVSAVPGLEATLDAVRHHHERWDGQGYPEGLIREETPLMARLMAVADSFSAMTTDRPYRQGMERAKALAILRNGSGVQWDPQCVAAFLSAMEKTQGKVL